MKEGFRLINVSEIKTNKPQKYETLLQEKVYAALESLDISYERVETDEVITMEDCEQVNLKLDMHMVKTLFLCNRQKTNYYLFITSGDKPFKSKDFSKALGISRVSFASKEDMTSMLQTKIGAATVFSTLIDTKNKIKIIFDKDVTDDRWYGCSDGTITGYLKISTNEMIAKLLPYTKHQMEIVKIS